MRDTRPPDKTRQPRTKPETLKDRHPAGPHAQPHLTDNERTPGTGALPDKQPDDEAESSTG